MYRDDKSIIEDLRTNLKERYIFEGGRTLLRELLQNADDSGASRVRVRILPGWPDADHPLLRVPGLLVANDGRYDDISAKGISRFGGSVKALDTSAIGRFGMGQKTAFHVCDAFLVVSSGYDPEVAPLVVNPYIVIAKAGDACRDWELAPTRQDRERLLASGLSGVEQQMVQWYPLRSTELAPKATTPGFMPKYYDESLLDDASDAFWLSGIVTLLRHVQWLEVMGPDAEPIVIDRANAARLRFAPANPGRSSFGSSLKSSIQSTGKEIMEHPGFGVDLTTSEGWPDILDRQDDMMVPQKALPHGAIAILVDPDAPDQLDITWSVFLPVKHDTASRSQGTGRIRIFLHGYFFVTSGRDEIPGVTDHSMNEDEDVSIAWNKRVRDELVLPLLPAVLFEALEKGVLDDARLQAVVASLNDMPIVRQHRTVISSSQVLARTLNARKIGWGLHDPSLHFRPLPEPINTRHSRILELLPDLVDRMAEWNLVPTIGANSVLAPVAADWSENDLARIAELLTPQAFCKGGKLKQFSEFLDFARKDLFGTSDALVEPVLTNLRRAMMQRNVSMAEGDNIKAVLQHLPSECVLAMPSSVMSNSQLRSEMAAVNGTPLCVNKEWCTEGQGKRSLALSEAKALLTALQPLLHSAATEDAAATASLAVLQALNTNLDDARRDPEFGALYILRVDKGLGFHQNASLDDVFKAADDRRLFSSSNENRKLVALLEAAAPGAGAMVVTNVHVARRLAELRGGRTYASDPAFEAAFEAARLAAQCQTSGPDTARLELLNRVWNEESKYRPFLRAILAGLPEARHEDRDLLWIQGGNQHLDDLARQIVGTDHKTILLSSNLLKHLDENRQETLGVRRFDGATLGEKLVENRHHLAGSHISPELFEALFSAGIPDRDLERLPIFDTPQGRITALEGYRRNPELAFPVDIEARIPILHAPEGVEAYAQFMRVTARRIWSKEAQQEFLLGLDQPSRYARYIIAALDNSMSEETAKRLSTHAWLTLKDGRIVSPEAMLELPDVPRPALPSDLAIRDDLQPGLLSEKSLRVLTTSGVLKDKKASRQALIDRLANGSLPCWIGNKPKVVALPLQRLAAEGADIGLPGWPLLAWLLEEKNVDAEATLQAVQLRTTQDPAHINRWMAHVARIAAKGIPDARTIYDSTFGFMAKSYSAQIGTILAGTMVPTRAGSWKPASEVVSHGGGVTPEHKLDNELTRLLHEPMQYHDSNPKRQRIEEAPSDLTEQDSCDSLRPILERAIRVVPAEMLAVLVAMLGQSEPWRRLMSTNLSLSPADVDGVLGDFSRNVGSAYRSDDGSTLKARSERMRILFKPRDALEGKHEFLTLAGTPAMLPLGSAEPLEIIGNIREGWKNNQNQVMRRVLHIVLPDSAQLTEKHVTRFCQTLADHYIGSVDKQREAREAFDGLLAGRARFAEHVATAVRAEIRDQLPKILGDLKLEPDGTLEQARKAYEDGIKRAGENSDAVRHELKQELWAEVDQSSGHQEMLDRVRVKIREHGYVPAGIFFELFQNADDAWQQDAAWTDGPGRFEIKRSGATTTIQHWGRLINVVRPGTQGEVLGWHRDLYHMLLLNLSDKDSSEAVTGRFGLGFKSIHRLADQVRIASRYVACHVRGGLLPEPWDEGKNLSFSAQKRGRPATIIAFEQNEGEDYDQAWKSFRRSARWLPAMARGIRDIEIQQGARIESFRAEFADTAAAGIRILTMTGAETGKAIAFDLDDDTTLFLPLGPTGPIPPDPDTPNLWLLAPLDVDARPKWLMNSRSFRVDPGRGKLSGTLEDRKRVFQTHGAALAERLESLADTLAIDWHGFANLAGLPTEGVEDAAGQFWCALAESFLPDLRNDMLRALHVDDTVQRDDSHSLPASARVGWARLVSRKPVFPTRLSSPFAPLVRATDVLWQVQGVMAMDGVADHLADCPVAAPFLKHSVSEKAAGTLERIGSRVPSPLHGGGFLKEILRESNKIDPELATWIGTILSPARMKRVERIERDQILEHLRHTRFLMADGSWGDPGLLPKGSAEESSDEAQIAGFAPDCTLLSEQYTGPAIDLYKLARDGKFGALIGSASVARFARQCRTLHQKRAALLYLLYGERGQKVADELRKEEARWLPKNFEDLCASDFAQGLERSALQQQILPRLYAREHEYRLDGSLHPETMWSPRTTESSADETDPDIVLDRLHAWWTEKSFTLSGEYDRDTYHGIARPKSLRDKGYAEDPEGWFTFFGQAVFRSVEWGNTSASRNFIKDAREAGWWGEMARISQQHSYKPWTDRLDELASTDGKAEDYRRWRRALGELYVVAKWLPDYVEVFRDLPKFVKRDGTIRLEDHWWPSASPSHQRRGTEGASLIRALGTGANWMIREAVRAKLWNEDSAVMHRYGWANSAAMRRFAQQLGWYWLDERASMDASPEIYKEFETILKERASFGGALDLPVQLLMSQKHESKRLEIFRVDMDSPTQHQLERNMSA